MSLMFFSPSGKLISEAKSQSESNKNPPHSSFSFPDLLQTHTPSPLLLTPLLPSPDSSQPHTPRGLLISSELPSPPPLPEMSLVLACRPFSTSCPSLTLSTEPFAGLTQETAAHPASPRGHCVSRSKGDRQTLSLS